MPQLFSQQVQVRGLKRRPPICSFINNSDDRPAKYARHADRVFEIRGDQLVEQSSHGCLVGESRQNQQGDQSREKESTSVDDSYFEEVEDEKLENAIRSNGPGPQ